VDTEPLLVLDNVCRYFSAGDNEVKALDGVSFKVEHGEFVAIMGQSGSGKSTLMNIIGCLDKPTSGQYKIAGQAVNNLDTNQLSALRLTTFGFVFQRYQLLANQSALSNVAMPAIYAGADKKDREQRAYALLEKLGMADRQHHRPSALSGGQQQRVSIARALINGAEVILADEPTGALDSASGEQVLRLLKQLNTEFGTTIVLITHDADVAHQADRIVQMKDGHLRSDSQNKHLEAGSAKQQQSPRASVEVFPRIGVATSANLALHSLQANWFRTLLTLLGIIIGVASVVSMMAIGEGGKQQVLQRIEAMGSNLLQIRPGGRNIRSGTIATLSMDDANALTSVAGVISVAPERGDRTTLRYGSQDYGGRVKGVTADYFTMRSWTLSRGVFFDDSDQNSYAAVMLLGATVAEQLFPTGDDPIGQYVMLNNTFYQVIGVLNAKGASAGGGDLDDEAYIPITTAQLKFFGNQFLSGITVQAAETENLPAIESQINTVLKQRHGRVDFMVRNTASLIDAVNETQDTLTSLLGSVAAISLLVGGIGVMNIMLVNVSERRREIGLRIATGAKPSDILRQFNIEALLVCLLGGIIGVALGLGVCLLMQSFNIAIAFSLFPPLLAFSTSLLVGWVFGYAPARKAAALDPITALAEA